MKIVHILYALNTGGTETMLVDIANEQTKTENISIIIINNVVNETIAKNFEKKINVFRINREPGSRYPGKIIKLNVLLNKLKPDIIHCHNHTIINIIFLPLKAKKYLTVHGIGYPINNFKKYDTLFAISESVKNDILSKGDFRVQVVHNGIKTELITNRKPTQSKHVFKIVQIGRLDHEKKGQDVLLGALTWIKQNRPDIHFTIDFIGEGTSLNFLEKIIIENNLQQHVTFLGNRQRSYVYENLCKYDLLVQPSIYEGFGLTVVEAMAAKVPVLVSNIHGPMEIIGKGKYGSFFESGNIKDCANKIVHISENHDHYITVAEKAFELCSHNFSITSTAKKYLTHY
jgi:glycosyltransferase involved in cell wall biosynthesis